MDNKMDTKIHPSIHPNRIAHYCPRPASSWAGRIPVMHTIKACLEKCPACIQIMYAKKLLAEK
jgi:hypothetical protein